MFVDFTLNLQYESIWTIYISYINYNYFNQYTSTQNPASFWFKIRQSHDTQLQLQHASAAVTFVRSWAAVFQAKMLHQFGGSLPLQSFPGPKTCLKDGFNQNRTWRLKEISLLRYTVYSWIGGWFEKKLFIIQIFRFTKLLACYQGRSNTDCVRMTLIPFHLF